MLQLWKSLCEIDTRTHGNASKQTSIRTGRSIRSHNQRCQYRLMWDCMVKHQLRERARERPNQRVQGSFVHCNSSKQANARTCSNKITLESNGNWLSFRLHSKMLTYKTISNQTKFPMQNGTNKPYETPWTKRTEYPNSPKAIMRTCWQRRRQRQWRQRLVWCITFMCASQRARMCVGILVRCIYCIFRRDTPSGYCLHVSNRIRMRYLQYRLKSRSGKYQQIKTTDCLRVIWILLNCRFYSSSLARPLPPSPPNCKQFTFSQWIVLLFFRKFSSKTFNLCSRMRRSCTAKPRTHQFDRPPHLDPHSRTCLTLA